MHRRTTLKMVELNPSLTCPLCKGYLIGATTLVECPHSFCRSCLLRYLCTSRQCPVCDTVIHKTRPLLNLRVDRTLQSIVYKLKPDLFKNEMKRRRDFYAEHPPATVPTDHSVDREDRGEVSDLPDVTNTDDGTAHLSLEYYAPHRVRSTDPQSTNGRREQPGDGNVTGDVKNEDDDVNKEDEVISKRYLRCPAAVCVKHIKKFIRKKFDLKPTYQVEITHLDDEDDPLPDEYTLMDVAYIYAWRWKGPLSLVFRVFQNQRKAKAEKPAVVEKQTTHGDSPHGDDVRDGPPLLEKESNFIAPLRVDEAAGRLKPLTTDPSNRDRSVTCETRRVSRMERKRKNDNDACSKDISTDQKVLPLNGKKRRHWRNGVKQQTHKDALIHDDLPRTRRKGSTRSEKLQRNRGLCSTGMVKRNNLKILLKKENNILGRSTEEDKNKDEPPVLTRVIPR